MYLFVLCFDPVLAIIFAYHGARGGVWRVHVNDPLGAVERLQDEDEVLNCGHPPNTKLFTNPAVDVGVGSSLHGVPKTSVLANM